MPNLQNRIPHQRAERIFFSGLGQCTKAGAMEPPSHLCVRERTRLLVLFPRFGFSNKKIGGNVEKMPNLQNRIPHQRAGRIFFSGLGQCTKTGARAQRANFSVPEGLAAKSSSALGKWAGRRRACFSSFWGLFSSGRRPPRGAPTPPGMGFRLQVFWGDSAKTPHLSTLITTKITFPCNLLEITGADFLYMEIARL